MSKVSLSLHRLQSTELSHVRRPDIVTTNEYTGALWCTGSDAKTDSSAASEEKPQAEPSDDTAAVASKPARAHAAVRSSWTLTSGPATSARLVFYLLKVGRRAFVPVLASCTSQLTV